MTSKTMWFFRRRLRDQGRDLVAQRRVGCEHAVIAMAVYAGRWHECGNPIDQLERGERQLGGRHRVAAWLWAGWLTTAQIKKYEL